MSCLFLYYYFLNMSVPLLFAIMHNLKQLFMQHILYHCVSPYWQLLAVN